MVTVELRCYYLIFPLLPPPPPPYSLDGTGVKELWVAHPPLPNSDREYGFTHFAMRLNEPSDVVTCPTDSRLRPDQRLLEDGLVDESSDEKYRLEEKQRAARRRREATNEKWKPV